MSDERNEMTPQFMDELASAYLDGEATPEVIAMVEDDPRLRALVEEHRAVKELIATPIEAPSQEVQEEMIAQALAQQSSVVSLETARRRFIGPRTRVILAAAAVVAAIAVAGVALFDRNTGDDDMLADDSAPLAAADDAPAAEADSARESSADEPVLDSAPAEVAEDSQDESTSNGDAEVPTAVPTSEELGSDDMADDMLQGTESGEQSDTEPAPIPATSLAFDTQDDLVNHVIQKLREPEEEANIAETDDSIFCPKPGGEGLDLQFAATVSGTELEVSVYRGDDGLVILQMTLPPDCEYISHLGIDWGK